MQDVTQLLNWLADNIPWGAIFESGALTGLLTLVLVPVYSIVRRVFDHHKQVMIVTVGIAGPLLTFGLSLLQHNPTTAPYILALQGLAISYATQPFYKVILRPLIRKAVSVIVAQHAKATALNEVKSATVPPQGLPITNPTVIDDFSH